jgi:hypothetical protein
MERQPGKIRMVSDRLALTVAFQRSAARTGAGAGSGKSGFKIKFVFLSLK